MYALVLPDELMHELYRLREEQGRGPIIQQVREAVQAYIAQERGRPLLPLPISLKQTKAARLLSSKYRPLLQSLLRAEGVDVYPVTVTIQLRGGAHAGQD